MNFKWKSKIRERKDWGMSEEKLEFFPSILLKRRPRVFFSYEFKRCSHGRVSRDELPKVIHKPKKFLDILGCSRPLPRLDV
jgi:hypothetical protein